MRVLTPSAPASVTRLRRAFTSLRAAEFPQLDHRGDAYLDYTGSGLAARSQIERHRALIDAELIGNPHSENPASMRATELVERAREDVLRFFGVDSTTHAVVFTANASAAAKLVAEAFPFGAGSSLALLADNHNSVNGIRRYADRAGATTTYLALDADLRLADRPLPRTGSAPSLLAYPAQSNFSGVRHPLSLVERARRAGYAVLLDAAAYAPTSRLDLRRVRADYVCVSFYKMFGRPTGVGALIATHEALARLERPWFAGGTVDFVSVEHRMHQLRPGAEAFEDGTPNFTGVPGLSIGLGFLESVGVDAIGAWVAHLASRMRAGLARLRWPDGGPMAVVYGPADGQDCGGTVAFNLLDREGLPVFYEPIERAAGQERVHLRGGCFCNPGAAEAAFGFGGTRTRDCLERLGPGVFSIPRFAECLGPGVATGALRASLGVASSEGDVDRLIRFVERAAIGVRGSAPARELNRGAAS